MVDGVFHLEALPSTDVSTYGSEGSALAVLMRMRDLKTDCRRVRCRGDLEEAKNALEQSKLRAVHISSHGNPQGLALGDRDDFMGWQAFSELFGSSLHRRHLFFSSCDALSPSSSLVSVWSNSTIRPSIIAGPREKISFDDALLAWNLVYHAIGRGSTAKHTALTLALAAFHNISACDFALYVYFSREDQYKLFTAAECAEHVIASSVNLLRFPSMGKTIRTDEEFEHFTPPPLAHLTP